MEARPGFSLQFLLQFWRLHLIFYSSHISLLVFFSFIGSSCLYTFLGYRVGLISGNFYKVLVDRDHDQFVWECLSSTGLVVAISVIKSGKNFLARRLMVLWRRSLTSHMQRLYIHGHNFYKLCEGGGEIDNPDQRLTADVNSMLTSYERLMEDDLFILPAATAYYAYKAYCASTWIGPTGMFGLFLLSFLNKFLMNPVAKRTAKLEEREGDFRYLHTNLREHAESVALQVGEGYFLCCIFVDIICLEDMRSIFDECKFNFNHQDEAEEVLERSEQSLGVVCTAQEQLFNARLAVDLSTNVFAYIGSIASYLIIAIPIFGGFYEDMTPGDLAKLVSNNAFVCMMLIYQLSQLVTMTGTVAGMVGSTYRVTEMLERLQWMPGKPEEMPKPAQPDLLLSIQKTDIVAAGSGNVLIKGLSLEVSQGQDLLVMGPSGAGKTSLLRVLRGLWPGGQGIVAMVGADQLACLPQREFLGQGSLRDLLAPGDKGQGGYQDETSLIELLTLVGLDGLLSRCGGLDGRLEQVISMLEVQPICRLGVSSFLLESVNDFCGRVSSTKDLPLLFLMRQPGLVGLFHLPVSSPEVIEPFKAIPFKVWACNFCSLTANDPASDECGLPIICIFLLFLFLIICKVVYGTIKGVKHKY